jgi:hypothetical protein
MTTPYTYLIGWPDHNKWYYGVRYANNCNPAELWITYKTSSKFVNEFVKLHGEPSIIEVRKVFNSKELARLWEHKVLKRLKVVKSNKWLNKTDNKSIEPLCGNLHPHYGKKSVNSHSYGIKRPYVSIIKKKEWSKNNPMHNNDCKQKSIVARSGDCHHMKNPIVKEKVSGKNNWIYKKEGALEERRKRFVEMNKTRIGVKYEKIPCPYCNINMPKNNYKRHVNICKNNLVSITLL